VAKSKPTVANYQGNNVSAARNSRAKGATGIYIDSNAPEMISASLYYELMVAHHAATGKQMGKYLDSVWKVLERQTSEYIDANARMHPKRLHHVYEWRGVGNPANRLFRLHRRNNNVDGFKMTYNFVQSRRVAPINPILLEPGPTGKVVKKSSIFRNKAIVMEEGREVSIKPKGQNWLAIPSKTFRGHTNARGIAFSRGTIRVKNVGGLESKLGFARTINGYFMSGLATKRLKAHGVLEKPIKVMKRAGERIPITAEGTTFKRGISKEAVERMAEMRVQQESQGVY
jgi:hypothetical protein